MTYLIIKNNKTQLIKYLNKTDTTDHKFYKSYVFYKFKCTGYTATLLKDKHD